MTPPRIRCLDAARAAVVERAGAYGKPEDLFAAIARRWSLTLGVKIEARQVALCMIDLKMERAIVGGSEDSVIDIAGYAACLYELDGEVGS